MRARWGGWALRAAGVGVVGLRVHAAAARAAAALRRRRPRRARARGRGRLPEGRPGDVLSRRVDRRLPQPPRRDLSGPGRSQGAEALAPRPGRRAAASPGSSRARELTLDDYLARTLTTGLLIAQRGHHPGRALPVRPHGPRSVHVVVDGQDRDRRCSPGSRSPRATFARSTTSAAAYVPELAGTEYGKTSLRHLLQMSSGVRFSEQYTGTDDVSAALRGTRSCSAARGARAR